MITQRRQTYASHVDFDSFSFYVSISMQKILKGSLQPKLKGASVWPFNACSRSAYRLKLSYMIIVPVL